MKLYQKLFLQTITGIMLIFVISGIIQVHREAVLFKERIKHDVGLLARILTNEISEAWKNGGAKSVEELIHDPSHSDSKVRFNWFWSDQQNTQEGRNIEEPQIILSTLDSIQIIEKTDSYKELRAYSYFSVPLPGERPGVLEISESLSGLKQYTRTTVRYVIMFLTVLLIIVGIILALDNFWLIAKPLKLIMRRTKDIQNGRLDGHLEIDRNDEIGELARSIDEMAEELIQDREKIQKEMNARIDAMDQLRHADRLRSIGRLASGVAHELGTPLNVISGRAGLIATEESASEDVINSAETIRDQCRRMTSIISQLLDFARRNKPQSQATDLNRIILQTLALIKPLAKKQHVKIEYSETGSPAVAVVDSEQLEQVFTNLITNAVQAMPKGGNVCVKVYETLSNPPEKKQEKEKRYYVIEIKDEGAGISPENLSHIFDPFFTTKGTGEGTGLGLSISYGIIQEHGGWIDLSSELNHGSTFNVYIPAEEIQ